jgi:S1-C subfamily serine protease
MSDFNSNRPPIPGAPDPRQGANAHSGYDPRGSQDDVQASNPLYVANEPQYNEPQYNAQQGYDPQANAPQAGDPQGYEPQANGPQYNEPQAGDPLNYDPQANVPQGEPWHDTAVHAPIPTVERLASDDVPLREYVPGANGGQGKGGKGGMSNTLKSVLLGLGSSLVGGAVVAALFSFTPLGTVQSGVTSATTVASPTTAASEQVNGQAITLNGDDDATLANAVSAKALPSVVSVYVSSQQGSGMGSGVILDKEGHVLTNYHVAGDADELSVQLNGKSYSATILGSDSSSDLAVLTVDFGDTEVTPIERGDSSTLSVGDWVMTVGSPFGLDQSVSSGIVSSLYRHTMVSDSSGNTVYANLIQVDAAINPGNSGGALVNINGNVIGINSNKIGGDTVEGMGFAIPISRAIPIIEDLMSRETLSKVDEAEQGTIGISGATVTSDVSKAYNMPVGVYVAQIIENGGAAGSDLQEGDIITAINGQTISSMEELQKMLQYYKAGTEVTLTVQRQNGKGSYEEAQIKVTLGTRASIENLPAEDQQDQSGQQDQNSQPEQNGQPEQNTQPEQGQENPNMPGQSGNYGQESGNGYNDQSGNGQGYFNPFQQFGFPFGN